MKRFCQRCRTFRDVDWDAPGTAQYCVPCIKDLELKIPTEAQRASQKRRLKSRRERFIEALARLEEYKAQRGCCFCTEADPACLDFHYEDPAETPFNIDSLVRRRPDLVFLMKEIETCKIICANCYRKRLKRRLDGEFDVDAHRHVQLLARHAPHMRKERPLPERPAGFEEAMAELRRQCFSAPPQSVQVEIVEAADEPNSSDQTEFGLDVTDPE